MSQLNLLPLTTNKFGFLPQPVEFSSVSAGSADSKHYLTDPAEVRIAYSGRPQEYRSTSASRLLLEPQIDLSSYWFRAVVDFVVIKVKSRKSQISCQKISRWIGERTPFFCPVTGSGNHTLLVRLNAPSRHDVVKCIDTINRHPHLDCVRELAAAQFAIEIQHHLQWAGDPKHDMAADRRLWEVTELLWRHFLPPAEVWDCHRGQPRSISGHPMPSSNQIWRKPRKGRTPANSWAAMTSNMLETSMGIRCPADEDFLMRLDPNNYVQPAIDGTTVLGGRNRDITFRIYHAIRDPQFDSRRGPAVLGLAHRRARVEVALEGDALRRTGIHSCHDIAAGLRHVRRKHFKSWLPTFKRTGGVITSSVDLERFQRGGCYAVRQASIAELRKDAYLNRRVPQRRVRKPWPNTAHDEFEGLVPYTDLNKRCADALRRAEKVWLKLG